MKKAMIPAIGSAERCSDDDRRLVGEQQDL